MVMHDLRHIQQCGLPSALEAMGERWSFLILRGALSGLHHFEEFQSTLGIARNILASRLTKLVEKGILIREPMNCDRRKVAYRLTEKGRALATVMVALRQWGEKWECGVPSVPVLSDRRDCKPIQQVRIYSHDGRALEPEDLVWVYPDEEVAPLCTLEREEAEA